MESLMKNWREMFKDLLKIGVGIVIGIVVVFGIVML